MKEHPTGVPNHCRIAVHKLHIIIDIYFYTLNLQASETAMGLTHNVSPQCVGLTHNVSPQCVGLTHNMPLWVLDKLNVNYSTYHIRRYDKASTTYGM